MASAPIILVPGFWLGAWAWDEVATALRAGGHDVTALTLPGLESADANRAEVTFDDHVDAICDAVKAAGPPVVLVVHSGAGAPGYAVTDRIPEQVAAMVYVDTGPATGARGDTLDGLTEEHLATFRRRAVPQPGAALRGAAELSNPARLGVPSTVVCTAFTAEQYREALSEGYAFLGGLAELRDVTYVDLPTSHWPMWSRPEELAAVISDVARGASRP